MSFGTVVVMHEPFASAMDKGRSLGDESREAEMIPAMKSTSYSNARKRTTLGENFQRQMECDMNDSEQVMRKFLTALHHFKYGRQNVFVSKFTSKPEFCYNNHTFPPFSLIALRSFDSCCNLDGVTRIRRPGALATVPD